MVAGARPIVAPLLAAVGLLAAPGGLRSQVAVDTRLEPDRTFVGGTVDLVLEVRGLGLGDEVEEPLTPALAGADVVGSGRESRVEVRGVSVGRVVVFRYTLRARRAGSFAIHPPAIEVDGRLHRPPSVRLVVDDAGEPPVAREPEGEPPAVFAVNRVDRRRAWVGEQITLTFAFYHDPRVELRDSPDYEPPETPGFWRIEIDRAPVVSNERLGGRTYHVQRYRYALFPLRAGEHTIGPATVRVVEPDPARWWTSGRRRTVRTEPLTVEIEPLPAGAPDPFAGAVGRYRLSGGLRAERVEEGVPIELEVTVRGSGNPTTVPAPILPAWPGIDVGRPSIDAETRVDGGEVGGRKTFRWVLVPSRPGPLALGAARLPYFDPAAGRYVVDTLRLGEIRVAAAAGEEVAEPVGPTLWPAREPKGPPFAGVARSALYWATLGGPWLGWLALLGLRRIRDREPSPAARRREIGARLADARESLARERPGAVAAVRAAVDDVEAELRRWGGSERVLASVERARGAVTAEAYGRAPSGSAVRALKELDAAVRAPHGGWTPGARTVAIVAAAVLAAGALVAVARLLEGEGPAPAPPDGAVAAAQWEEANRAYREGDAERAVGTYRALLAERPDAWLEADLAAALWRSGRGGEAVAAYRRALVLAPRSGAIRRDLARLRSELDDPPAGPGPLVAGLDRVRTDEVMAALLAIGTLGFGIVLAYRRRRPVVGLAVVGAVATVAVVAATSAVSADRDLGVVVRETATAGTPRGAPIAPVAEGAVVEVLERSPAGWRVRAGDGPAGWLAPDAIAPLHSLANEP